MKRVVLAIIGVVLFNFCGAVVSVADDEVEKYEISASDIKDGLQVYIQLANTSEFPDKFLVAYPNNNNQESVKINDALTTDNKDYALWTLVATGNNDVFYTDRPTYYLYNEASKKYYGNSVSASNISPGNQRMVDNTDKAYAFSFLTKSEIDEKEPRPGTWTNKRTPMVIYNNDENEMFVHHSNEDGSWFRLGRYGSYIYVYYYSSSSLTIYGSNQAMLVYSAQRPSEYTLREELADAIKDYGGLSLVGGTNPGEYDAAVVNAYNAAVEAANNVSESATDDEIRAIIDNLKAQYDTVSALQPNPITDGYYYIMCANQSVANMVVYDPKDKDNVLLHAINTANPDGADIFYISQTASGQYVIQNLGTKRYINRMVDVNNIALTDTMPTATYQQFEIQQTGSGQYYWKDSGTQFYYNKNGTTLNRYYKFTDLNSVGSWYLRPVAQSIIDSLMPSATYTDTDGNLVATGSVSVAGLQSALEANGDVASIDLTGATLPADLTGESLNAMMSGNQVAYLPEGAALTGNNLVVDGMCANLVLTDKTTFAPAMAFTATTATITRQLYPGLNTVCLPFAFTASDIKGARDVKIYVYESTDDATVTFNTASEVEAGQAAIVSIGGTGDEAAQYTITKSAADIAIQPVKDDVIAGTFVRLTPGEGAYKLNQAGTAFVQTTATSTVLPFRFYLKSGTNGSASFSLVLSDDDDPTGLSTATDGGYTLKEIRGIYDVNGQQLQSPRKGLNIFRFSDGTTRKVYVK